MLRPTTLIALAAATVLPAILSVAPMAAPQEGPPANSVGETGFPVRWRADFEAARKEAKTAKKPLFVVFRCER